VLRLLKIAIFKKAYYSSINAGKSICVCPLTCDEKPNYKVKVRAWKFRVSKRDAMKGL
jgi:hypothetical protein